jgi:hypothetical protein
MILNTGGRTDTVNYFSEWLLNRFEEGYALSRNPFYHDVVNRIDLSPDTIDVVEFCSKNYRPILPRLHEITDRFNCHFHYTITAYEDVQVNTSSLILTVPSGYGRKKVHPTFRVIRHSCRA